MRLDHIAYRSKDRKKTAKFFKDCFGYKVGAEFDLKFDGLFCLLVINFLVKCLANSSVV